MLTYLISWRKYKAWFPLIIYYGLLKECVLLTSTPKCVVSPRRAITRAPRGETTHEGVDVNNTHLSIINPYNNITPTILVLIYQYSAYQKQIKAWIESYRSPYDVIAWPQRRRPCGVFKSWISIAHCHFQQKWRVLHHYDRYPYLNRSAVCLLSGSPTWEFPRVLMTWRTARPQISNVRSPMYTMGFHWHRPWIDVKSTFQENIFLGIIYVILIKKYLFKYNNMISK